MTIDLSDELLGFKNMEWDTPHDQVEYLLNVLIEACVKAIPQSIQEARRLTPGSYLEDLPQEHLEFFLMAAVAARLNNSQKLRLSHELVKATMLKATM